VESWLPPTTRTRFELGVDGLRIVKEGKRRYFLPGDAFVQSILGMGQLRRHIQRLFPGDDVEQLTYYRFRSISFVSGVAKSEENSGRDATPLNEEAREGRESFSSSRNQVNKPEDSDDEKDSRPSWLPLYRGLPPVPEVNDASLIQAARAGTKWIADNVQPDGRFMYYYDAATDTRRDHEHPTRDPETDPYYNLLRHGGGVITLLLDELLWQTRGGRESFSAKVVSKGDGVSQKRLPTPSTATPLNTVERRRQVIEQATDFFVRQLVEYKTAVGKEAAYVLYNHKAKLGGSGIGLCALAMYQRLFEDDRYAGPAERLANHLISEINDQGEFRYYHVYLDKPVAWNENQRHFSFYYHYGDHPYPDGARAEGLLGAYQLALKVGDQERIRRYRDACDKVAAALLRLCNTPESVYSAVNPEQSVGGIRFKLTRQWFRVDTIQHVASFYLKLVATNNSIAS
jgi:hypothetical protein